MNANTYQIISVIGFSMAGALFFATLTVFFKLKIWRAISILSGRHASREIRQIRQQSTTAGRKPRSMVRKKEAASVPTEELEEEATADTVLLENNINQGFFLIKNDISIHTNEKIIINNRDKGELS